MKLNFLIISIILILLISIYYFNKKRIHLLHTTPEHYNNFCSYNPNLTYEKDLDDNEIDRLINTPSQFKLLRHKSIADLQKFINDIKTRQKKSSDDFASYGLLKTVIEASEENVFRDIQDPFKDKQYKYPRTSKKQDTIQLMEKTNQVMKPTQDINNKNASIDSTNPYTIERFESEQAEEEQEQGEVYEYKDDDKDPTWKLENTEEYEYIEDCDYPRDEDEEHYRETEKEMIKIEEKKQLLQEVESIIDTWLSATNCKQFQSPDYLHHFKQAYHNYMLYKFTETLKYLPSVDKPGDMTIVELNAYKEILTALPDCKYLLHMFYNKCDPIDCTYNKDTDKDRERHKRRRQKKNEQSNITTE